MSRDFKQEYEQHMNEQTPDLWARIEANLPAKEVPTVNGPVATGLEATGVATEASNIRPMKQRKGISRRWMTYAVTAAAALLICMLAVPVLRSAQGGMSDSANFMAKDAALEMLVEEAADAGEAENGSARYSADAAVPEADIEAECAVEQDADKEYAMADGAGGSTRVETTGNTEARDEVVNAATVEVKEDAETKAEAENKTDAKADVETKADIEETKQTAFAAEVTIWEVYEQDGKVLYKGDITGQEVILVFGESVSADVSLEIGVMYELTLEEAEEDAVWDYVIVGM